MSETFAKLKELLHQQKKLSKEEEDKLIAAHGDITPEERIELEAEKLKVEKEATAGAKVSMDDYLAALKVLDSAAEGSDEYKKAEAIVEKYESGQ